MAGVDQRPGFPQPDSGLVLPGPITPDSRLSRRDFMIRVGGAAAGLAAAGTLYPRRTDAYILNPELTAALGPRIGEGIPVPSDWNEVTENIWAFFRNNDGFPKYKEGEWFLPVYDITQANEDADWRGIGPHLPIAFKNLPNGERGPLVGVLDTHGNVGELIVEARGGSVEGEWQQWVEVGFMLPDTFRDDGDWSRGRHNPDWKTQYTFHGLRPFQPIFPINIDTGRRLVWPDGSLVDYTANGFGTASFEMPERDGKDTRVGFVFEMSHRRQDVQPQEVKIERGPNDKPNRRIGENPLPDRGTIKPMIPGQHR